MNYSNLYEKQPTRYSIRNSANHQNVQSFQPSTLPPQINTNYDAFSSNNSNKQTQNVLRDITNYQENISSINQTKFQNYKNYYQQIKSSIQQKQNFDIEYTTSKQPQSLTQQVQITVKTPISSQNPQNLSQDQVSNNFLSQSNKYIPVRMNEQRYSLNQNQPQEISQQQQQFQQQQQQQQQKQQQQQQQQFDKNQNSLHILRNSLKYQDVRSGQFVQSDEFKPQMNDYKCYNLNGQDCIQSQKNETQQTDTKIFKQQDHEVQLQQISQESQLISQNNNYKYIGLGQPNRYYIIRDGNQEFKVNQLNEYFQQIQPKTFLTKYQTTNHSQQLFDKPKGDSMNSNNYNLQANIKTNLEFQGIQSNLNLQRKETEQEDFQIFRKISILDSSQLEQFNKQTQILNQTPNTTGTNTKTNNIIIMPKIIQDLQNFKLTSCQQNNETKFTQKLIPEKINAKQHYRQNSLSLVSQVVSPREDIEILSICDTNRQNNKLIHIDEISNEDNITEQNYELNLLSPINLHLNSMTKSQTEDDICDDVYSMQLLYSDFNYDEFNLEENDQISGIPVATLMQKDTEIVKGEYFANEGFYDGQIVGSLRHGQGKLIYQNGTIYIGDWKNNKRNGYGELTTKFNQLIYEGQWYNNQQEGKGTLYNINKINHNSELDYKNLNQIEDQWIKYQGSFQEGRKHGLGTLFFINNENFEGMFIKNHLNGVGVFTTKFNQKISGEWMNDQLIIINS